MPIQPNELVWRPSSLVSDITPAQNGGAVNFTKALISGVKNNLFPDVSQAERLQGSEAYRKVFIHVASAQLLELQNPRVFMDALSPGDDFHLIYPAEVRDTQNQITSRPYGVGGLAAPVVGGAVELQLQVENYAAYEARTPFRAGDLIRIANKPATGGSGSEEFKIAQDVSYTGGVVTLTLENPVSTSYGTSDTVVSSVWTPPNVVASFGDIQRTVTGSGDFAGASAVTVNNRGTADQLWTITFTGSNTYTLTGDTVGGGLAVANGTTLADLAVNNPGTGFNYMVIKASAFTGTFQAGDVITFRTYQATLSYWDQREVPANSGSLSNNFVSVAIQAESA